MTATLTFYGLEHLAVGATVSVWLAGLDCGDYVIASGGTIAVPYGSDPGALLTADYLKTISDNPPDAGWPYSTTIGVTLGSGSSANVMVPCIIGGCFASQGQTLRPLGQDQSRTILGMSLGETRRPHMYSALVVNGISNGVVGPSFGSQFAYVKPARFVNAGGTLYDTVTLYNRVHWDVLDADYDFDGQVCWTITRPYPLTLAAVGGFTETQERTNGGRSQQ